jgi:hypothetical protein
MSKVKDPMDIERFNLELDRLLGLASSAETADTRFSTGCSHETLPPVTLLLAETDRSRESHQRDRIRQRWLQGVDHLFSSPVRSRAAWMVRWQQLGTWSARAVVFALLAVMIWMSGQLMRQLSGAGSTIPAAETLVSVSPVVPTAEPDLAPARISLADAQELVKAWAVRQNPNLDPQVSFPLQELTTPEAWDRLGVQVFQVTGGSFLYESYLVDRGRVLPVGTAFGGTGVSSMVVADLDHDSAAELVFAYSFGSGIHQSRLALYSPLAPGDGMLDAGVRFANGDLELEKVTDQQVLVKAANPGTEVVLLGALQYELRGEQMQLWVPLEQGLPQAVLDQLSGSEIIYYSVTEEEIIFSVAEKFHISPESILGSNLDVLPDSPFYIPPGVVLTLPPVDGLVYAWKPGDRLEMVAAEFGVQPEAILRWPGNRMDQDLPLSMLEAGAPAGTRLVIPGGSRIHQSEPTPAPDAEPSPSSALPAELVVEEYSLAAAPGLEPLTFQPVQGAMAQVLEKREASRDIASQKLASTNSALAPFGYRLVKDLSFEGAYSLYQGEKYLASLMSYDQVSVNASQTAFILPVYLSTGPYLLTPAGIQPAEMVQGLSTYLGDDLLAAAVQYKDTAGGYTGEVSLTRAGELVFTVNTGEPSPMPDLIGLWTYGDHWVLEVRGQVIQDGSSLNELLGYDETFGFQLMNGVPFYFYSKDGQIGTSYNGEEFDLGYSEVPHSACCSEAALNPGRSEQMVWFFAQREGIWYYVEIGAYPPEQP